jgi:hypothetical protein
MDISHIITGKKASVTVEYCEGVTVTIGYLPRERVTEIIRAATQIVFDKKTHERKRELDNILFGENLAVESITGWSGFESDGEPVPCNEQNIRLMIRNSVKFSQFFSDQYAILEDLIEEEKEAVRKNSVTSSGGGS